MPGGPGSDDRTNLIGIAYPIHFFGVDIAREEILTGQADRPVFPKVCRKASINVKPGVIIAVTATVYIITVKVVDRNGVVIKPCFL
ncbi:Uncharacterised protein [Enterobacter cloacae]|nr:Uncharacterised protein [Enterobacter cloacae]